MNKLELFEKKMTIKELSDLMLVSEKHIRVTINKCYPNLLKNGVKTYLTEEQCTRIKLEIEKNPHLDQSVELPKTNLEKKLLIQQAMNFLSEEVEQLKQELTIKETLLLEQAPKVEFYNTVAQTDKWYNAKEVSNILAIPEYGRNNLLKKLRAMGYLTEYNKPYQKWIDQKLMKLAEDKKGFTFAIFSQKFIDRLIKDFK